jgi:hypothetical protein
MKVIISMQLKQIYFCKDILINALLEKSFYSSTDAAFCLSILIVLSEAINA